MDFRNMLSSKRNPDGITLELKGNNKLSWEEQALAQHQVLISIYSDILH